MSSAHKQSDGEARRLLRAAAEPVAYDVEAGLSRHRQLVAQNATLPAWADEPPARRSFWSRPGPWGGLVVLLGALGYLAVRPTAPAPQVVVYTPPVAADTPVPTVTALSPEVEPVVAEVSPTPGAAVRPVPAPSSAQETAVVSRQRRPQRAPTVLDIPSAPAPAPADQSLATLPLLLAQPAPAAAEAPQVDDTPTASGARATAPELTPSQPEVQAELEQLRIAEQLLPDKPARTLAIVRAGFERFRPGYLNQERRYLEVMALLGLGLVDDARLLGREFVRNYPSGPYRRKVEQALAR